MLRDNDSTKLTAIRELRESLAYKGTGNPVLLCRLNQAHRQYVDSSGLNESAATPLQTEFIIPEKGAVYERSFANFAFACCQNSSSSSSEYSDKGRSTTCSICVNR